MDMKYHKAGNPEEECRINMVEEMIKVKRGKLQLENFNNTEIDQLLDCLCTTKLYSTILYLYVNLSLWFEINFNNNNTYIHYIYNL